MNNDWKMTLQDLKSMYPKPSAHNIQHRDGKVIRFHATQKNHRHIINPVWLPAVPKISPAEYRRKHLGKRNKK